MVGILTITWAALVVSPAALVRSGEEVEVPAGEQITDDLYLTGGELTIDAPIDGDLVVAGGSILVRGRVSGDVMAAGGDVRVEAPVDGSIRVAGGEVRVTGSVGKDLVVAGGSVELPVGSVVVGDVIAAGGSLQMAGEVRGDARVRAGELDVSGHLRALNFEGGDLEVKDGARVDGLLRYSAGEVTFAPGAVVGSTQRVPVPRWPVAAGPLLLLVMWARALIGLLLFGLLALALAPAWFERASNRLVRRPGESLGIGVAGAVIGASLAIVSFSLGLVVGGWWIGLIVGGLLLLAVPVSLVVASLTLGRRLWKGRATTLPWLHFALGALLLMVVGLIPIVGQLLLLVIACAGFGASLLLALDDRRSAQQRPPVPPPLTARPVPAPFARPPAPPPAGPPVAGP